MMIALLATRGARPLRSPVVTLRSTAGFERCEAWLDSVYGAVDYASVIADEAEEDAADFSDDQFIYGESSLPFFLECLDRGLGS